MESETPAIQGGLIGDRIFRYGVIVSLLLILIGLMQSCGSVSRSSTVIADSVQKPSIIKPQAPNFPINFCEGAQSIQLDDFYSKAEVESSSHCGSKVVFVPFGQKFRIKANKPGITKVCFWLNGGCAAVRAIRNSDNLELGANLPAESALRFSSNPPGTVNVQLVNY